jgi:uncharacterized protein (TIGR00299 family) protein
LPGCAQNKPYVLQCMGWHARMQPGRYKEKTVGGSVLYIDPWSGVSGDMLLAALLDTDRESGWLETVLRSSVDALGLEGTTIEVIRDVERGIACTRVRVDDGEAAPMRHLREMEQVIGGAALSARVRERALGAVRRLAEVEAAVHGCAMEEVHFHEIGAVDTLVDLVGAFVLVEALGIERVAVGVLPVGGGSVEIEHGKVGVPAPATVRLLEGYRIVGGPEERELTTPTGALLVGELGADPNGLPAMRAEKVGYGAGSMELDSGPNVLRVLVGSDIAMPEEADSVVELRTNLDDVSPEVVAYTARLLLEAGALDVWMQPAYMKKGRSGVVLHALIQPADEATATGIVFEQTGTLGIRRMPVTRHVAARGVVRVKIGGVEVGVKWGKWRDRVVSVAPEYEECVEAAASSGLTLKEVMELAIEEARQKLGMAKRES